MIYELVVPTRILVEKAIVSKLDEDVLRGLRFRSKKGRY